MGTRHHMVVAACKGGINSGGLRNREVERSFQVKPSGPVGNDGGIAEVPLHCCARAIDKLHSNGAARQVVGTKIPRELHVEVADGYRRVTRNSEHRVYLRHCK